MPTIYEAKFDGSNGIQYLHISLAGFYLGLARRHAELAAASEVAEDELAGSVIAITFAGMAIEAFLNEVAEDVLPEEERDDFAFLRKNYRKEKNESSVAAKCRIIFQKKYGSHIDSELQTNLEELIFHRNNLVHYKLTELAGKIIMPPPIKTELGGGRFMTTVDFMVAPERVEPPFLQKINRHAAEDGVKVAENVINKWESLAIELDKQDT